MTYSLVILFLALIQQILGYFWKDSFFANYRKKIAISLCLFGFFSILFYYLYLVYAQYALWKNAGPPASFLIPPHNSATYVFLYHGVRFLLYYGISLIVASVFFVFLTRYNKRHGNRFFEYDELYFASLSIFLLGYGTFYYPWILYLCAIAGIGIFASFFHKKIRIGEERLSFYFFWIPLAIVGILMAESLI